MMSHDPGSSSASGPASLLALVVDIPPHLMLLECGPHHYLNCILAFANLHLSASVNRKLCIVAATHSTTGFLYPPHGSDEQVSCHANMASIENSQSISLIIGLLYCHFTICISELYKV